MEKPLIFLILLLVIQGYFAYRLRARAKISRLLFLFSATLFFLLIIEFGYRLFFRTKKINSTINSYFRYDSLMGYKFKDTGKLKAVEYFSGGDTIYNTFYTVLNDTIHNQYNYPFRKGYRNDSNRRETVFLGCSVTMGECLPDEETLPCQYGKLSGISAVNRGYNGFGVHQVYQLFKFKYANQDNHNRVFVYTFLLDHLIRANGLYTWNMAGPYFEVSGDSLVFKGPSFQFHKIKGLSLAYYASFFGAFTFIRNNIEKIALDWSIRKLSAKDLSREYLMIKKMAERINATGGRLVILNWDSNATRNKISEVLSQDSVTNCISNAISPSGGKVLPVSAVINFSDKKYFVPKDGHPSALAYSVLADYLIRNLQ
ncbi:MAG: hypothetical protein JST09_21830 [Bacteroidetes bacterium]|nr:hypothetical protein [Bacteroidota bacterium]